MKKIIIVFLIFTLVIFLLPAVFTKQYEKVAKADFENQNENSSFNVEDNEKNEKEVKEEKIDREPYNYSEHSTIKLLHNKTGEIEEIHLDTYLLGVVSSEMPAYFEQEALNAQAIVARTYTIYTINHNQNKHGEADICDSSSCCQAWISKDDRLSKWENDNKEEYWEKIEDAVYSTKGKIITYEGEPIDAFFHSNSGGITEMPVNVWGGTNFPYLQSVQTSGEDAYSQFSSEIEISKDELINKIKEKYSNFEIDFSKEDCIKILEYTNSNRVKTIKIGNIKISGVEIRNIIGLRSSNFNVTINENNVKFEVQGYGHGVGMSQTGADSMAKQGANYEEIIKHFYTGVEIVNL